MKNLVSRFVKDESGATAIEYGLIAAGISLAIIAVVNGLGTNLNTKFTSINTLAEISDGCEQASKAPALPGPFLSPVGVGVHAMTPLRKAGSRPQPRQAAMELVCLALALALLASLRIASICSRSAFPDCSSLTARLGRCSDLASAARAA